MTPEGSVYTIKPRLIMPEATVEMPKGLTRRFWLTVRTPADARPGLYKGNVSIQTAAEEAAGKFPSSSASAPEPLIQSTFPRARSATRSASPGLTTIPRPPLTTSRWSLKSLRQDARVWVHGLHRLAVDRLAGVRSRASPCSTSASADPQMKLARELGFMAVTTYGGGVSGFNAYFQDTNAMRAAGFQDYSAFVEVDLFRGPGARRRSRAGFPSTTISPTSRWARTRSARRKTPRPIVGPSPRARPSSRGPAASRAPTPRPALPALQGSARGELERPRRGRRQAPA